MRDPTLAERVSDATRSALTRIIDLCLSEQVDALLIAGDLYDGDQTSMKTARFLAGQLKRLDQAGIRCFIIRGNHDNEARITRELTLPQSVTVFGAKAGVEIIHRDGGKPIAIHGVSFSETHAPESLLPRYKAPVPDTVNIGLLHTSLGGSLGHSAYAPCTVADLRATGFQYWALGHIHSRAVVEGEAMIVMPGMIQGRDINEAGVKTVTLVTVEAEGGITLEERPTSLVVFQRATADVSDVTDWREIGQRAVEAATMAVKQEHKADSVIRLQLGGTTPLAWRIRRDIALLQAEVEVALEGRGIWLEKLETACRMPGATDDDSDALSALERIAAKEVLGTDAFSLMAATLAGDLKLPVELRDLLGDTQEAEATALKALATEGLADVLARLRADGIAD